MLDEQMREGTGVGLGGRLIGTRVAYFGGFMGVVCYEI